MHTIKYKETSLITKIYTEDFGVRSYLINGVRKAKAKVKSSLFQPMNIVDLEVYHHLERPINRIKEIKVAYPYQDLPFNIFKSAIGQFMCEVIKNASLESAADKSMYLSAKNHFALLDKEEKFLNVHVHFLIDYMKYLGIEPEIGGGEYLDLENGVFSNQVHPSFVLINDLTDILKWGLDASQNPLEHSGLNNATRKEVIDTLLKYYQIHLPHFKKVKSVDVLEQIFSKE